MALRDLLVYIDQTSESLARLRLACDLARRNESFITALFVREWSPEQLAHRRTAELAGRPLADFREIDVTAEGSIDRSVHELRSALEQLAAQHALQTEFRIVQGAPSSVLPQHARYADLCVLAGEPPAASTSAGYGFSEEMLFAAGRPVLLLPRAPERATLGAHIAVAWHSSRAAARALNDALPLLERSERTTVLSINAPKPTQLLEHLRRHAVNVQLVELADVSSDAIASALQDKACSLGADMLVAGAHGRAWLRDMLLGSVTRELLSGPKLPLMASD